MAHNNDDGASVYVGNLPYDTREEELERLCNAWGKVVSVSIVCDRDSKQPRGFAFIKMSGPSEAHSVLTNLTGQTFGNRPLRVNIATDSRKIEAAKEEMFRQEQSREPQRDRDPPGRTPHPFGPPGAPRPYHSDFPPRGDYDRPPYDRPRAPPHPYDRSAPRYDRDYDRGPDRGHAFDRQPPFRDERPMGLPSRYESHSRPRDPPPSRGDGGPYRNGGPSSRSRYSPPANYPPGRP